MKNLTFLTFVVLSSIAGLSADPGSQLMEAARSGDLNRVRALIQSGVSIDFQDRLGNTPLMVALLNDQYPTAESLINNGANVNITNLMKTNALFAAVVKAGDNPASLVKLKPIIKLLIAKGTDINYLPSARDGGTVLTAAAISGNKELVEFLLAEGANPLIQDRDGETTLKILETGLSEFSAKERESNEYRSMMAITDILKKAGESKMAEPVSPPKN